MSRRKMTAGSTSVIVPVMIQDTTSLVNGGLGSLAFNTAGLTAKYLRDGDTAETTITLQSMTVGTWASGGFIACGSVTGLYELGIPNAALATGAKWVIIEIYGAANMLPVLIEIELDTLNYQASGGKVPATIAAGDVAANAIDGAAIKQDAVTKIQAGLATTSTAMTLASAYDAAKNAASGAALTSTQTALTTLINSRATPQDVSPTISFSPVINPTILDSGERNAIADSVWTRTGGRTLTTFGTLVSDIVTAIQGYLFGTGSRAIDFLITDTDGEPIESALITVLQNGTQKAFSATEDDGHAAVPLGLNDGSYKVPVTAEGFNPRVFDVTVSASGTVPLQLTRIARAPSPPNRVTGWLIASIAGVPTAGIPHTLTIADPPNGGAGQSFESESRIVHSADSGLVQFPGLTVGQHCEIQRGNGRRFSFVVPDPSPETDFEIVDSIGPSA